MDPVFEIFAFIIFLMFLGGITIFIAFFATSDEISTGISDNNQMIKTHEMARLFFNYDLYEDQPIGTDSYDLIVYNYSMSPGDEYRPNQIDGNPVNEDIDVDEATEDVANELEKLTADHHTGIPSSPVFETVWFHDSALDEEFDEPDTGIQGFRVPVANPTDVDGAYFRAEDEYSSSYEPNHQVGAGHRGMTHVP